MTKTVVVGDIHGDLFALFRALKKSGFVKFVTVLGVKKIVWTAKNVTLVFLGDILDAKTRNGTNGFSAGEAKIISLLTRLKRSAKVHNSKLIVLAGNHELMNTSGDFRYVSDADMKESGGSASRRKYYSPGNEGALKLSKLLSATVRIGDFVMVHASVPRSFYTFRINVQIHSANRELSDYLTDTTQKLPSEILPLFWSRELTSKSRCTHIGALKKATKQPRLKVIHAHTPVKQITHSCNDSLWNVDTGMSRALYGKVQILSIDKSGKRIRAL